MSINNNNKKLLPLLISILVPLIILLIPTEMIPITGLTLTQQRVLAIFIMAALMWIWEPIPNYTASIVVIIAELVLVSNSAFKPFYRADAGIFIDYHDIFASFAAPIIMLFIGGFGLAIAIQKYNIDFTLAKVLLKPFGNKTKNILLGLMFVTAIFSMFMSNTATTAMMLSILLPILNSIPNKDKIKGAFALGIPFAANIGGIGTPIGTPPNAIALSFLPPEYMISFSGWMMFAVPFMLLLLMLTWILLCVFYKSDTKIININIPEQKGVSKNKQLVIYITFAITILLWMTDKLHGMRSYVVALIPMGVFFATGILQKDDLKGFNWDVLWLVAGGIAVGTGMEKTGLAENLVETFNLTEASFIVILLSSMFISYLLSNFMSHTAASNLLFPIIIAIALQNNTIVQEGLVHLIVICTVFASSLSMILPISTPPNALGYSTGQITTKNMATMGIIVGIGGLVLSYFFFMLLNRLDFSIFTL